MRNRPPQAFAAALDADSPTATGGYGSLINSLGTAITSAVSPLAPLARWLLPGNHRLLGSTGGFQVSIPEIR